MSESCGGCGAELFAGQQFCRRCGAPTRRFSTAEIPTQILPGQPQPQGGARPTDQPPPQPFTTPLSARDTDPVYPSRFAQYHSPPAAAQQHAQPAQFRHETAPPARRRRRWPLWLGAIFGLFCLLGFGALVVAVVAPHVFRPERRVVVRRGDPQVAVPAPPAPAIPPVPVVPGLEAPALENGVPLGEEGAEVTGDKTIITKTFPLKAGATFALSQVAGDVTVEGWDGDEAQVTITKRGGTAERRSDARVLHEASATRLGFKTDPAGARGVRDVEYEIRLPRSVRQLEIGAVSGNVSLSNLAADVSVSVTRGSVAAEGLTGTVNARTMKGDIEADLDGVTPSGPQVYSTTTGSVELSVGGANATIKAETVSGSIEADDDLGISVARRVAGQHAAGTVGRGGPSVVAKTVSGNVRIKE